MWALRQAAGGVPGGLGPRATAVFLPAIRLPPCFADRRRCLPIEPPAVSSQRRAITTDACEWHYANAVTASSTAPSTSAGAASSPAASSMASSSFGTRCDGEIGPDQLWDLGATTTAPALTRPEHGSCNRASANELKTSREWRSTRSGARTSTTWRLHSSLDVISDGRRYREPKLRAKREQEEEAPVPRVSTALVEMTHHRKHDGCTSTGLHLPRHPRKPRNERKKGDANSDPHPCRHESSSPVRRFPHARRA